METLQVNTTIHCAGCVSKLKPHLDASDQIDQWSVDLDSEGKTLKASGEGITTEHISSLLQKEGYDIKHSTNAGHKTEQSKSSFWSDTVKWKRAGFNTLNCLIGCSIGDFAMILFLQAYYPETNMIWQMILGTAAGLCTSIMLETMILKSREGFAWGLALKTAFGMSFISMVGMELAMNTTDFMITGGKASFDNPMYWTALLVALVAGFAAPLPYNYYKLKKFNLACH